MQLQARVLPAPQADLTCSINGLIALLVGPQRFSSGPAKSNYVASRHVTSLRPTLLAPLADRYIVDCGVVHGGLAARNVLIDSFLCPKITDFGQSRWVAQVASEPHGHRHSDTNEPGGMVSLRWAAPEVISSLQYSESSDVWSFGIVAMEIFGNGAEPYEEMRADWGWYLVGGHNQY